MTKVIRGQTLSFGASHHDVRHESKGAIAVGDDGTILWSGPLSLLPRNFQGLATDDYGDNIVMPGFIDAHIHFPQLRMLAAPGKDLLDWLTRFTFPEEARYADAGYAAANAKTFLQTLYANGTTAAMAFCSVHKACADALFAEAQSRNMALVTGKTMMDRNAIPAVHDDATTGGVDSEALYQTWHGKGRLRYAISPRFAITSTEAQLKVAGELLQSYPDAMLQTHLSESPGEIAWIKTLFPNERDYTAVYERFGLVNDHGVFAHGVHLSEGECQRLHDAGATIAHCPTSNNFLDAYRENDYNGDGLRGAGHDFSAPQGGAQTTLPIISVSGVRGCPKCSQRGQSGLIASPPAPREREPIQCLRRLLATIPRPGRQQAGIRWVRQSSVQT